MEYDKTKFKIWSWKHPFMLHWILNPGLAINELVFGQRVPKVMLVEKNSTKALEEKSFVPCPHCQTLHAGKKWSTANNAFKNWFGLYCDNCGETIPCLTNLTSCVVLALTSPIWILFKNKWMQNWLQKQPERYRNLDLTTSTNPYNGKGWIKEGMGWGLLMYLILGLVLPIVRGESIIFKTTLFELALWIVGGLLFGLTMKLFYRRMKRVKS